MKQLSGQDASFLYLDSREAHLNLTGLYIYQQPESRRQRVTYRQVLDHVRSRLDAVPMFRQKLVRLPLDLDHPYWTDDPDFDLEFHIRRHGGAAPRSQRQLLDAVTAIHIEALDMSRPPWEMHVFEKLDRVSGLPENCFAIVAKYHHASIDGASGSELVDGLHDSEPSKISQPADNGWQAARGPGLLKLLTGAAINNIRLPVKLAKTLVGAVPGVVSSVLSRDKSDSARVVPKTRFNDVLCAERVIDALSLDLARIKSIRQAAPGATVNDVILAICGGGLRAWLQEQGELPSESLVAMVPVNLRSSDEQGFAGNKVGTMFVPIHTDVENPVARLRAVRQATQREKSADHAISMDDVREISSNIPALPLSTTAWLVTGLGLGHRVSPLCNCTITNVPGPRETIYFGPAKMVKTIGCGPVIDGMGLIISIFTYRGNVTFALTSSPAMLPDPSSLSRCIAGAFEALHEGALGSGSAPV